MKFSLLLLVAVVIAAVLVDATPSADLADHAVSRQRRNAFLGSDISDFFQSIAEQAHRAWAASTRWAHRLLSWFHRTPHVGKEDIYHINLPGGHQGVVRIVTFSSGHKKHQEELLWDGHQLSWKVDGKVHKDKHLVEERLRVTHRGVPVSVPLRLLAKHLKRVPAGSRIAVELLGKSSKSLRIVLHVHVKGQHGKEDAKKSVSVLVSQLAKEAELLHASKEHAKQKNLDKKRHKEHSDGKEDSQSKKHNDKKDKRGREKSSSSLVWNGSGLDWDEANQAGKKHRQLRVSQDGVSHVIPLAVLAKHVKKLPAGSKINFEVEGKTMHDLKIVLFVHRKRAGKTDKTKIITIPVAELIKEADVAAQNGGAKQFHGGNMNARLQAEKPQSNVQKNSKIQGAAARPDAKQV